MNYKERAEDTSQTQRGTKGQSGTKQGEAEHRGEGTEE